MKPLSVLKKYFNTNNDPVGYTAKTLKEFSAEVKELSVNEKNELAQAAGTELGIEVELATE